MLVPTGAVVDGVGPAIIMAVFYWLVFLVTHTLS